MDIVQFMKIFNIMKINGIFSNSFLCDGKNRCKTCDEAINRNILNV